MLVFLHRKKRLAYSKEQGFPVENTYQSATGSVKDRHNPALQKHDPEGYYYSTENEYAYIADIPPPSAGPTSGGEGFYSPGTGYGPTASISSKNIHPPLMRGTSAPGGHPCIKGYDRNGPVPAHLFLDGEDPPKYFELDPQAEVHNGRKILVGKTSSSGAPRGGARLPVQTGSTSGSKPPPGSGYHLGKSGMDGLNQNKSV